MVRFPHLNRADGTVTVPVAEPAPEPPTAARQGAGVRPGDHRRARLPLHARQEPQGGRSISDPAEAAAGAAGRDGGTGRGALGGEDPNEEVDLDALAHIEELLQQEPERVSALLSRWALSEERFAETNDQEPPCLTRTNPPPTA